MDLRKKQIFTGLVALCLLATVSMAVSAQFGVGIQQAWTDFHDPLGRFSLSVPPGWTYQDAVSTDDFFVFYGPGAADLFYLEILRPTSVASTPTAVAQDAIQHYAGPDGLEDFQVITPPSDGVLANQEASFIVYTYHGGSGSQIVEGRAFALHGGLVYSLAFADSAAKFDASVPVFNQVMESLKLMQPAAAQPAQPGAGFGLPQGSSQQANSPTTDQAVKIGTIQTVQDPPPAGSEVYTSPGDLYRFSPPAGWELWEEQSSMRGDEIEPWNGVFNWDKPMTKTLFIWDYFDEWEQTGAQYEIVLAVIHNVAGTLNNALESLKDAVMGNTVTYTVETTRVRIGTQPGLSAQIVVRPGYTEPWSMDNQWHKTVTFFALKQGLNFFVWAIPNEIVDHPDVVAAMESFEWLVR